jgi:hypothetical protein
MPASWETRGAQRLKSAPVEVLLLIVDGPPARGLIMADVQHNVWVIPLS